jgi:hypothetical protein
MSLPRFLLVAPPELVYVELSAPPATPTISIAHANVIKIGALFVMLISPKKILGCAARSWRHRSDDRIRGIKNRRRTITSLMPTTACTMFPLYPGASAQLRLLEVRPGSLDSGIS